MSTRTVNYLDFQDSEYQSFNEPQTDMRQKHPESVKSTMCVVKNFSKGGTSQSDQTTKRMAFTLVHKKYVPENTGARGFKIFRRRVFSGRESTLIDTNQPLDDFGMLRKKLRKFRSLPNGWDSYSAVAPSDVAVDAALVLVRNLERNRILPEYVIPTSESTILVRYRCNDVWYDWEFHPDGDVAVMRKPLFDKETYHDFRSDEVSAFFSHQASKS